MKPTRARRRSWIAPAFLLASAVAARGEVLVVDEAAGPGSLFTSIQDAVDAALEGDTILVRDGGYGPFYIVGKSLTVVADGDDVTITYGYPSISVANLTVDQRALVRGFRCSYEVRVSSCEGPVWFEDIVMSHGTVHGYNLPPCYEGAYGITVSHGAKVTSSSQVTFTRCELRGATGIDGQAILWGSSYSGDGLRVTSSTVQAFDCVLVGGPGHSASSSWLVDPGGPGLTLDGGTITIVGCTLLGGPGGLFLSDVCGATHLTGGPGVLFADGSGTVNSAESTAGGGVADIDLLCPGQTGPPGDAISGVGTIVPLVGYAHHLEANSPVRGGEVLTFDVGGQPGEVPMLLVSLEHQPIPLLNQSGVLLVGLPASDVFVLSPLPASGEASLAFPVPNVGAVAQSVCYYAQAAFIDPSPAWWLGAGTSVVLLDASF